MLESRHRKAWAVEVLGVGPEAQAGSRVLLTDGAGLRQLVFLFAAAEADRVFLAVAPHAHVELFRQGIDDRNPDAVQAARKLVVLIGELAPGMQLGEDYFDPGNFLLRVDIDRHAATVIDHAKRLVGVQNHTDLRRVTGDGFVDTIVYHLLREVIGPGGVGIHARSFPDRFEPRGVVLIFQRWWFLTVNRSRIPRPLNSRAMSLI